MYYGISYANANTAPFNRGNPVTLPVNYTGVDSPSRANFQNFRLRGELLQYIIRVNILVYINFQYVGQGNFLPKPSQRFIFPC